MLVAIAGPTAAGKTELSIELAKNFSTEIVSSDSRQFYKELNIGTSKPDAAQLAAVKHHFINSLSITQDYNAARYEEECLELLNDLFKKSEVVIMSGGSGMYIKAVSEGFDELPSADKNIRNFLNRKYQEEGIESLQNQLKILDPEYYETADTQNPQRLKRAIEICMTTGGKYSALAVNKKKERNFKTILIGLNINRTLLYEKINTRVDLMMMQGLLEEVRSLYKYKKYNALQTIGYKELISYIEEKISLEQAVELIKKNTRNYAKRQMTWFKNMPGITWFEPGKTDEITELMKANLNF